MQEYSNIINDKISRIIIDENNDIVIYYMRNGDVLSKDLTNILKERKEIFKNYRISQKCHELTKSFRERKKIERLLNPVVIKGLNDNVYILEYIRCINEKINLPFELVYNIGKSRLSLKNKIKMRKIVKNERKLGAKVNMINKNVVNSVKKQLNKFAKVDKKENTSIITEEYIDKQCEEAKKMLKNYCSNINNNLKNIDKLESIEYKLRNSINWYMNNKKNNKAENCICILKNVLTVERKYFYEPNALEECKNSRKNAMLKYLEPFVIKNFQLQELTIKNMILKGEIYEAEKLYKRILESLGINLTTEELKKTIDDGMKTGSYYIKENIGFRKIKIKGNERVLKNIKYLEKISEESQKIPKNEESQKIPKNEETQKTLKNEETQKTLKNEEKEKADSVEKKYSKTEIEVIIQKYNNYNNQIKYKKGIVIPVIDALISYIKENKDENIQRYLENILEEINEIEPIDLIKEKEGRENKYNICIFDYMSNLYKDGVRNLNGEDIIIKNEKKYAYYMYILNKRIKENNVYDKILTEKKVKEIEEQYLKNVEKIELDYFSELLFRNKKETIGLRNKILKSEKYSKAMQDLEINSKSDEIRFLALSEDLKNGIYRKSVGLPTNLKLFTNLREKIHKKIDLNELENPRLLQFIAAVENEGIKDKLDNKIVEANKELAEKIYKKTGTTDKDDEKGNIKYNKYDEYEVRKEEIKKESEIYVCSDLHGQYELYKTIVNQLREDDKLYILGDVIDRGTEGIKILQDILQHKEQIELFVGNHELMMIESLFLDNEKEKQNWIREANGGRKTLENFLKLSTKEQEEIRDLLLNATVYKQISLDCESIYLVHAKANQKTDKEKEIVSDFLNENRKKELYDCVWARLNDKRDENSNEVWKEEDIGKDNAFTIIGHTPTDDNKIEVHDTYAIVDCGATNYGNGCVLRLSDGKIVYYDNMTKCIEQLKDNEER